MKYKTIEFNGIDVTCYEDGSVEWLNLRTHQPYRTTGSNTNGYRAAHINNKVITIHRLMAIAFMGGVKSLLQVDHINGDKSDNRLKNLRMVTHRNNQMGYQNRSGGSSKYRGVCLDKRNSKWMSIIGFNGKQHNLGLYHDESDAARSYDAMAYLNGFSQEALNFNTRKAQGLILCALHISNQLED